MNEIQKKNLIAWLNRAHGLERSLTRDLEQQAKRAARENKPEVEQKIREHLAETKHHAQLVAHRVEQLGGKISKTKKTSKKGLFGDDLVKSAVKSFAAENLEIASYNSILTAAAKMGDRDTVKVCSEILKDEERMANWIREQIPRATQNYVESLMKEKTAGN